MTELKEDQEDHKKQPQQRLCDFCGEVTALLYCRADSAKLCFSCDREVHSTNQLFTKHTRWLLCDICDTSPASILCVTDNSVLCQNCDWESHNIHTTVHERRPVEGFTGCPSVSELLSILGFEDLSKKSLLYGGDSVGSDGGYDFSDWLVWDTPSVVSLDDLIAPNDSGHNFPAIGVPPLPKNRNAACGKHKEEILRQLRELSKSEPCSGNDQDETVPIKGFQSMEPGKNRQLGIKGSGFMQNSDQNSEAHIVPSSEGSAFHWCSDAGEFADQGFSSSIADFFIETKCLHPDRDSDVGDTSGGATEEQSHNPPTETFQMLPKVAYRELNSQERETAVSRYKEKKKTRRYEKHIRYESRKVRAESRTRIKGRFAKMDYRDSPMHQ